MTISYREYIHLKSELDTATWRSTFKRVACELFHIDDRFVELGFDGIDEVWCVKCKWRRKIYRMFDEPQFKESNGDE